MILRRKSTASTLSNMTSGKGWYIFRSGRRSCVRASEIRATKKDIIRNTKATNVFHFSDEYWSRNAFAAIIVALCSFCCLTIACSELLSHMWEDGDTLYFLSSPLSAAVYNPPQSSWKIDKLTAQYKLNHAQFAVSITGETTFSHLCSRVWIVFRECEKFTQRNTRR